MWGWKKLVTYSTKSKCWKNFRVKGSSIHQSCETTRKVSFRSMVSSGVWDWQECQGFEAPDDSAQRMCSVPEWCHQAKDWPCFFDHLENLFSCDARLHPPKLPAIRHVVLLWSRSGCTLRIKIDCSESPRTRMPLSMS